VSLNVGKAVSGRQQSFNFTNTITGNLTIAAVNDAKRMAYDRIIWLSELEGLSFRSHWLRQGGRDGGPNADCYERSISKNTRASHSEVRGKLVHPYRRSESEVLKGLNQEVGLTSHHILIAS
jgi:hypothetical protein